MHPSESCASSFVIPVGTPGPEQLLKLSKQSSGADPAQQADNESAQACKAVAQMVQLGRAAMLQWSVWSPSVPYVSCHHKWAGSQPDVLCVCVSLAYIAEIGLNCSLLGLLDPKGWVTCQTRWGPFLLGSKQPEGLSALGLIYCVYCSASSEEQCGWRWCPPAFC